MKLLKSTLSIFMAAAVCCTSIPMTAPLAAQPTEHAAAYTAQTKLTDGIFQDSQDIGEDYLLSYDVDRLAVSLFRYSSNRGNAPIDMNNGYGGWEDSGENGIGGHVYGHYMSACAAMYRQTGNEELKKTVERGVQLLGIAQDDDGFVGGFSRTNLDFVFAHPTEFWSGGQNDAYLQGIWAPWYTLHKLMAGLIDAYRYLGIKEALDYAEKIAAYAKSGTDKLNDAQMEKMLVGEHGGINESFAWLYEITGKEEYLQLAKRFSHKAVMDPLARGENNLPGLHANTQIPKICGAAKIYQLTGDDYYRRVAENFWQYVKDTQTYANGGTSNYEFFTKLDEEPLSNKSAETCCVYNMLKLTEYLYAWKKNPQYMDYYENVLYNQILGSQNHEGRKTYSIDLRMGASTEFLTREMFECCMGTGMENPGNYTRMIYAAEPDALYMNLYINSRVQWQDMVLLQKTDFPNQDSTTFFVEKAGSTKSAINLRIPGWTTEASVKINGETVTQTPDDGYIHLERNWKEGDKIELSLPMNLQLYTARGGNHVVALKYGPILLAGDLGLAPVKSIVSPSRNPEDFVTKEPTNTLRFQIKDALQPGSASITLKPFYEFEEERRMIYWNLYTPEEFEEIGGSSNQTFEDKLADATLDYVIPSWLQSETDHHMVTTGNVSSGTWEPAAQPPATGQWRAVKGGTISYTLKVDPQATNYLLSMFWGSDDFSTENRTFDILADGQTLRKDYTLNRNRPDKIEYYYLRLPSAMTRGKHTITVTYRADEGKTAGGIFGVRTTTKAVGPLENGVEMATVGNLQDIAKSELESLDLGDLSSVTSDLSLPTDLGDNIRITWSSSKPEILSAGGHVTRGTNDVSVTLHAIASVGNFTAEKDFFVTIRKAEPMPPANPLAGKTPQLHAKSKTASQTVYLTWTKIAGADGYILYRKDITSSQYKPIKEFAATATSYSPRYGYAAKYAFQLQAFHKTADGTRVYSNLSPSVQAATAPAKTSAISVKYKNKSLATLSWKKVSGADGYQIYRSSKKNGKYALAATITNGRAVSHSLKHKNGSTYYYKVRAYINVDNKGKTYGGFSKAATPKISAPNVTSRRSSTSGNVTLKWSKPARAAGYKIYRSKKKHGTYKRVKTLRKATVTKFTEKRPTGVWYYKVCAYEKQKGKIKNGALSPAVKISLK